MQHRDKIALQKIVKEIEVGRELIGKCDLDAFLKNEMQKRAVAMTVINVGELVKTISEEMRITHKDTMEGYGWNERYYGS
jgi:uncharacterized protein with HEPN domain